MRPILVIGDSIRDIYIYGRVGGIANEDPVLRFIPNGEKKIIEGGANFVQRAIATYSPVPVPLVSTSISTIVRYVDKNYSRNVFTVDNTEQILLSSPEDLLPLIEQNPKIIVIWDDMRNPDLSEGIRSFLRKIILSGKLSDTLIIVDSADPDWNSPSIVHYQKMSIDEYRKIGLLPLYANHIITSSSTVILNKNGVAQHFKVQTVENPIDTTGAGDIFLAMFTACLYNKLSY